MAEGDQPPEVKKVDYPKFNWDRGSLDYVFASDFTHFVIESVDKYWRTHDLITHRSAVTPFNTEIQYAVQRILGSETTYMSFVFKQMTKRIGMLTQARFNMCAAFLKIVYFGHFDCFAKLLKYFSLLGYFAAWALQRKLHMAPFFCVDIIMGYIGEFFEVHKFISKDDFWYFFQQEAGETLKLGDIKTLTDKQLQSLLDLQRTLVVYEQTAVSEEISSVPANTVKDVALKKDDLEVLKERVSTKKKETVDSKVQSSLEQSTDTNAKPTSEDVTPKVEFPEAKDIVERQSVSATNSCVKDAAQSESPTEKGADYVEQTILEKDSVSDVEPHPKKAAAAEAKVAPKQAAEARVAALEARVAALEARVAALEAKVAAAKAEAEAAEARVAPKEAAVPVLKSTPKKPPPVVKVIIPKTPNADVKPQSPAGSDTRSRLHDHIWRY